MCTNCRWVYNKYIRESVLVKCGKCPACQQEKAAARATRIRNNIKAGQICLFVTLTYDNFSVPYIWRSDLVIGRRNLLVYRDCYTRRNRHGRSYNFVDDRQLTTKLIDDIYVGDYEYEASKFKDLKNRYGRIGVCYYPDIQRFFKRLRSNLNYKYNDIKFSYFCCSEYGSTTFRPHYHILIFIPAELEDTFRAAIVESWPYADKYRTRRGIEVARDAASYVASYVNSNNRLPSLFTSGRFKQKHSYSQGFGVSLSCFSLVSILEKTDSRSLMYCKSILKDGVATLQDFPIPKYVINRYFPKFKGFGRLSSSTLSKFGICPAAVRQELNQYGDNHAYDSEIYHKFVVRLRHCIDNYVAITGKTAFDYVISYNQVWNLYESQKLIESYKEELLKGNEAFYEYYDNVYFYLQSEDKNVAPSLDYLDKMKFCLDPNKNKDRILQTARLTDMYNKLCKQKAVTNLAMTYAGCYV